MHGACLPESQTEGAQAAIHLAPEARSKAYFFLSAYLDGSTRKRDAARIDRSPLSKKTHWRERLNQRLAKKGAKVEWRLEEASSSARRAVQTS